MGVGRGYFNRSVDAGTRVEPCPCWLRISIFEVIVNSSRRRSST
jgi:hypothetical protein